MKSKLTGITQSIVLALFWGLFIPLSAGLIYSWFIQHDRIEKEVHSFHNHIINSLARNVKDALLSFSPNEAQNMTNVLIGDPRILEINIYSSLYEMYLVHIDKQSIHTASEPLKLRKSLLDETEDIGYIEIIIDRAFFFAQQSQEQFNNVLLFIAMFVVGLTVIVPVIYFKVLQPIQRLIRQAHILSSGDLETAFAWKGTDEISILGKTFETMRQKLLASFQKVQQLAITDELTGLPNRRAFVEKAQKAIEFSQQSCNPLALVMIDLDHFKTINDTFGHAVGDDVLQEFSGILQDCARESDIVGRLGGEEFAICMPDTTQEKAAELTEHIRHSINTHTFAGNRRLTASFGVAPCNGLHLEKLFELADNALYRAKTGGRNCVEIASKDD